jgi:hypothetical protein
MKKKLTTNRWDEIMVYRKAGYTNTHSDIGRTTSVRFMSHQVVEYKLWS